MCDGRRSLVTLNNQDQHGIFFSPKDPEEKKKRKRRDVDWTNKKKEKEKEEENIFFGDDSFKIDIIFDKVCPEKLSEKQIEFLLDEYEILYCETETARFDGEYLKLEENSSMGDVVTCGIIRGTITCKNVTDDQLAYIFCLMKHHYHAQYSCGFISEKGKGY